MAVVAFLRRYAPELAIAAIACAIAWLFVVVTLHHTPSMGFPLDDSYIYLTYAKQFGRGEPFSYYPGGGYSAGSTSVLWPMLLAPFWTVGARGHALVWVSYLMCTALYAATAIGVYRLAARLAASKLAGLVAAGVLLAIAPFAFTALSGMEVAFASALLVWTMQLLVETPADGPPSKRLIACLAATSLSRPEATLLVGAIVGLAVLARLRARAWRAALLWASPLAAPIAWLVANKLFAGQFFPNTGVAKSHFYLPGFDWTYWFETVGTQTKRLVVALFWDGDSFLVFPRIVVVVWALGVVRLALWARRERRYLVATAIAIAPLLLMFAVIASSGLWNVQNYRYITPALPLFVVPVGFALAPVRRLTREQRVAWWAVAGILVGVLGWRGAPKLRADMDLFAQGCMDTNTQVVAIGKYLRDKQPNARVMFHDAGAIAYYGDTYVYDMLGLVTNYQAGVANNGPGSRFEFLESLPPERRPDLFAYYPAWMGTGEFFGDVLKRTPLLPGFEKRRIVGDGDMQVLRAVWDHVGTGERPLEAHPGWRVVDRVDVADLASERAHGWRGALGRRHQGEPTAHWSVAGRMVSDAGLVLDGGRTIREGRESFAVTCDATKPTKLVIRTGGAPEYPLNERLTKSVLLTVAGKTVAAPAPTGPFVDVEVDVPCTPHVEITASGPYRVFHHFVLQPD